MKQLLLRPMLAASLAYSQSALLVAGAMPGGQSEGHPSSPAKSGANLKFCPGGGMPCLEVSPETLESGRRQFVKSCGMCHGPTATGGEGPNLIRSALVRHDKNGDLIGPVIRNGRPDKGMPALSLNNTEIGEIVTFLKVRVADADKTSAEKLGHDYSTEKLLTGDVAAGKAFFNGAGGCAKCHSPTGDLAGIARKYSAIDLQDRFLYPSGKRPTATVVDASGKEWRGEVLQLDESDIAIQDADGWYHSWPRGSVSVKISDPLAAHRELLGRYTNSEMHNVLAYLESLK